MGVCLVYHNRRSVIVKAHVKLDYFGIGIYRLFYGLNRIRLC